MFQSWLGFAKRINILEKFNKYNIYIIKLLIGSNKIKNKGSLSDMNIRITFKLNGDQIINGYKVK